MTWRALVWLIVILAGIAEQSRAHSWYDGHCCNDQDCYQTVLGEVERHDGGWFVVLTKELIPFDDKRIRRSLDPLIHRCIINTWKGKVQLPKKASPTRCLYIPETPV